mgnify:CR=1 FL=1
MGNMSYCRFENTARDLADCVDAIFNGETTDLSQYEIDGLASLLEYSRELLDMKRRIEDVIERETDRIENEDWE